MDTWESFFREKSRRRSRHRYSREMFVKGAILSLLLGGIAVATWLQVVGLPR
jgi:hypothetical protein